jgi:hypothetical protein
VTSNKEGIVIVKKPILLAAVAVFFSATIAIADEHEEKQHKRIVVKTAGGEHGDRRKMLRELLPAENEDIIITHGENGETIIEKHAEIDFDFDTMDFPMVSAHGLHVMHGASMSEDAAGCVLKNISKVQVDAAAALLRQACVALNPEEETTVTE